MTFERFYELAVEGAAARVNDLSSRLRTRDDAILKRQHEQAIDELTYLCRGYNQMIIDKYKEQTKHGNA